MFKVILWDIDSTVLDFFYAERESLKHCFREYCHYDLTEEHVKQYSAINDKYWKLLEKGEVTKAQVMHRRFAEFLSVLNIQNADPDFINECYESGLADYICFIENAFEVIQSLQGKYRQYAVTNGAYAVQKKRLALSGLDGLFDASFISDKVGYEKPDVRFFNYVLEHIILCNKDEILIVGDSLTSDMQGGNNIGIKCCWYNPQNAANTVNLKIDYEIHSLKEIFAVLAARAF